MSDERREASNYAAVLVRAIIAEACSLGAGLSYTDEIDEGRDELLEYIAGLEEDRALLEKATAAYVGTDFEYPGYENRTCLILALPDGSLAGFDFRRTLECSSSPLAPTQEGA